MPPSSFWATRLMSQEPALRTNCAQSCPYMAGPPARSGCVCARTMVVATVFHVDSEKLCVCVCVCAFITACMCMYIMYCGGVL